MKTPKLPALLTVLLLLTVTLCAQDYPYLNDPTCLEGVTATSGITEPVTVSVIYDNYAHAKGMTADWGYSILIKGPAKTVLFDTGSRPGVFDFPLSEQALVLDTKKGLVVMTGCAHPGIVSMLKDIKSSFEKNIYMVFGGFHLMHKTDDEMDAIIAEMKTIGLVKCGATHCTGDRQIKVIREKFGDGFVELGVGNTIVINL
jgi:metal-dependent hydrolase (beta-lactamase superfamily II)